MITPATLDIFSIITPSYNQGAFIEDTIQSVLSQKGCFRIEYLIIDGESKDNTIDILQKYDVLINSKEFKPNCMGVSFSYIREKDKGPVDAITKGFRIISGTYCSWLNSDDYYLSDDVLSSIQQEFNNTSKRLVTGDGIFVDHNRNQYGRHYVKKINKRELLYLDYHILQPATFFKADLLNKYTLNPSYKCAFDLDLFTRIILETDDFSKIDKPCAAFRMWGENITEKMSWRRYFEEQRIAFKLSDSLYYFLISCIYRFFEIVLKNKIKSLKNNSRIKITLNKLYVKLQEYAYIKITGKKYRE